MKRITDAPFARRHSRLGALALGLAPLLYGTALEAATITLPPISIGAGVRTSFINTSSDGEGVGDTSDFNVNSGRFYMSGSATEIIKLTLNADYAGSPDFDDADPGVDNDGADRLILLDAIVRFEFSPMINIWMGRFLPPSDRANLYGPYYANHFAVFNDGIQNGHPSINNGRDNGVAYWGDFGKFKLSAGFFDIPSTTGNTDEEADPNGEDVIFAARAQYNFWDAEPGYYLNGTYYGDKDILAIGVATQNLSGDAANTIDLLLEKKLGNAGVATLEAEYAEYEEFSGYGFYGSTESDGGFVLGSYLFPQVVGIGKIQLLAKFATVTNETALGDFDKDTLELDLGYIMKAFNARAYLFYVDHDFENVPGGGGPADFEQVGLGIQVQI